LVGIDDEPQKIYSHLDKAEADNQNVHRQEVKVVKCIGYFVAPSEFIKDEKFNHLNDN
jgi:hypothetical protein